VGLCSLTEGPGVGNGGRYLNNMSSADRIESVLTMACNTQNH
jgi:hypothetical protein